MKENSKKVPDAPDILFVCPFHTGLTSGLLDEDGNPHEGYPVWHGMAVRASADNLLYINISKVWHSGKELPESNNEDCLLDYADGMTIEVGHTYTDPDGTRGWLTDSGGHLFEEIVQWAYLKDIVPALVNYKKEAQDEKKNKALFLDIMLNDRFVCTLKYMYCPLFAIRYEALIKFVLDKRPSLKGKPFRIMF